jgi:hypothetical protein
MVIEYCGNVKYRRLETIKKTFVELGKYVDASSHNMDLPNMLHLGSLPQTSGGINWLQLIGLLHDMVCTIVVVRCLKMGVEDDVGQVTMHSVNNTVMQFYDAFLLHYNEEDPIGRMVSITYAADVLVDCNGSIKRRRRKKKQL